MSRWSDLFSRLCGRVPPGDGAETPRAGASAGSDPIEDFLAGPAIPDDLVDAVLDGEVSAERAADALAALRRSSAARRRLSSTRRIVDSLQADRAAAALPDFSRSILSEVDRRRGLLDGSGMRRVTRWRIAAGLGLVVLAAGAFFAQRVAPATMRLAARPAPLGELAQTVPVETAGVVSNVREAVVELQRLMSPDQGTGTIEVEATLVNDPFLAQAATMRLPMGGTAGGSFDRGSDAAWSGFVGFGRGGAFVIPPAASQAPAASVPAASFARSPSARGERIERMSIRALFIEPGRVDDDEDAARIEVVPGR